jgi:hypothetical protein
MTREDNATKPAASDCDSSASSTSRDENFAAMQNSCIKDQAKA